MATKTKTTAPVKTLTPDTKKEEVSSEIKTKKQERMFLISESVLGTLLNQFQELPYKVASPLINFLQKNLQEVKPEDVKKGG